MANQNTKGNAIHLNDEQVKNLLIQLWQHGDAIDELWDAVIELKCLASNAGMPVKNAQDWQASFRKRAQSSALLKTQRRRFFAGLGLKFD
jgi:hypothetical protein